MRLLVLFGGQSAEHDVSCVTARHVLAAADPDRFEVVPIGITRCGRWVESADAMTALTKGAAAFPDRITADGHRSSRFRSCGHETGRSPRL